MYLVYRLISPSKKSYVGWTSTTLGTRISQHKWNAINQFGHCHKLESAIRKYGIDSFDKIILLKTDDLELSKKMEKQYIKEFDCVESGYNILDGGDGRTGWVPSPETRKLWSEQRTGRKYPGTSEARSKVYKITHPNGTVSIIKNLRKFCTENSLNEKSVYTSVNRKTAYQGYMVEHA